VTYVSPLLLTPTNTCESDSFHPVGLGLGTRGGHRMAASSGGNIPSRRGCIDVVALDTVFICGHPASRPEVVDVASQIPCVRSSMLDAALDRQSSGDCSASPRVPCLSYPCALITTSPLLVPSRSSTMSLDSSHPREWMSANELA
jgi:hypothetical protein